MKIRSGFIANSSSSSYEISYNYCKVFPTKDKRKLVIRHEEESDNAIGWEIAISNDPNGTRICLLKNALEYCKKKLPYDEYLKLEQDLFTII